MLIGASLLHLGVAPFSETKSQGLDCIEQDLWRFFDLR